MLVVAFSFSLMPLEPRMGQRSGDGEVMLGLPVHLYLWAGVVPCKEIASREPLVGGQVRWSQDALGKQAGQ